MESKETGFFDRFPHVFRARQECQKRICQRCQSPTFESDDRECIQQNAGLAC